MLRDLYFLLGHCGYSKKVNGKHTLLSESQDLRTRQLPGYIGSVKKTDNILLYLYLFNNLWKILISALMRYIFVVHCVGERCIVKDV